MTNVLVTVGPIPTKLDSVKFITNRFKGGLALKTAEMLHSKGHNITLMAWQYLEIKTTLPIIRVEDVTDYFGKVLTFRADAYILAAAVANLGPLKPFTGKFPSHRYKIGQVFPIDFTIMPRVIDEVKNRYPASTLIGYKLFDGPDEELIEAARKTLYESKANIIFANNPKWAKEKKITITGDGAVFELNFDQHIELIDRLLTTKHYRTEIMPNIKTDLNKEVEFIINHYPKSKIAGMTFGTFAVRTKNGFVTTTRGKKLGVKEVAFVKKIDQKNLIVHSNKKATLNAPLLGNIFECNPQINFLIHGHELIGKPVQNLYQFPGTTGDLLNTPITNNQNFLIQLPYHGYIAGFSIFSECRKFLLEHDKLG